MEITIMTDRVSQAEVPRLEVTLKSDVLGSHEVYIRR